MRYLILGPLEVRDGERSVVLGSAQQRAVLAMLVLRARQPVALDELVEALWGEKAPATAAKIVQNHISKLRRLLACDASSGEEAIVTGGGGYMLQADPEQIDASLFERRVSEAGEALAAGESKRAATLARDALALWRGSALLDFQYESFAQADIGRLEEQRLLATEHRIEAELALGKQHELLGELEQIVRDNPLRERLWELQMLALYRAGQQAEALAAYRRARTKLADLGLEPGRTLRDLEQAILRQDAELGAPARRLPLARSKRGWAFTAAGGAALLAAGLAAAFMLVTNEGENTPLGELQPLPESFCSPVRYEAGEQPQLLIASDLDLRGSLAGLGNQMSAAIEFTLRANGFQAGPHAIAYQACAAARGADPKGCSENAEAYARNPSVIGVIGPLVSACASAMIPAANRAGPEPVPIVSPSNTHTGLTRAAPGTAPEEPETYYPTGVRNYVRLMPADDHLIAANAVLARRLGLQRVFVLWFEGGGSSARAAPAGFRAAARQLGINMVGSASWGGGSSTYAELVDQIRRTGANGVFLAGTVYADGGRLLTTLRSALGQRFPILASDGFAVPDLAEVAGPAAEGMMVSNAGVSPKAVRGPSRRFVSRLRKALGEDPHQFTLYAAVSTELLLDAIGSSDGTRPSVLEELFDGRIRHGVLGKFAVTPDGDTTANQVTIYRVSAGRLLVDQVIEPSSNLLVGG